MSYTQFAYSNLKISSATIVPCQSIIVTATVTNVGNVVGDEVSQLYISFSNASVPVSRIKLVDFYRTNNLPPGQSNTFSLFISPEQMTVIYEYNWTEQLEPGLFKIFLGGKQPDSDSDPSVLAGQFRLTGSSVPYSTCETN